MYLAEVLNESLVAVALIQALRVRAEEVLLHPGRDIHVIPEKVEVPDAHVPREIDQLKSAVTAEVNLVRVETESLPARSVAAFYVRVLRRDLGVLRPNLRTIIFRSFGILFKPAWIAKIKNVQIIAKLKSIIKPQYSNVSPGV